MADTLREALPPELVEQLADVTWRWAVERRRSDRDDLMQQVRAALSTIPAEPRQQPVAKLTVEGRHWRVIRVGTTELPDGEYPLYAFPVARRALSSQAEPQDRAEAPFAMPGEDFEAFFKRVGVVPLQVRSTPAGLTDEQIVAIWREIQPDGGLTYPDAIRFARAILNTEKP